MNKVLITGGAGFVGSNTADRLLAQGCEVVVIDNYATGRRDNLKPHPKLKVFEGSIADASFVESVFQDFQPEAVLHAAASYKDPEAWIEDVTTNALGSINVVRASMGCKVGRLVYLQTALCYGLHPLEQPITLVHPLYSGKYAGGSSYAISKTVGEQYIELSGLDFISFRLANAYGPRNISGPLPTFYQRLTTGKKCFVMNTRRDFVFISDMVDVITKALAGGGSRGYYHISSGGDYSVKELFDATVKALGIQLEEEVEVRARGDDDVFTILIDPSKTQRDFDWRTKTPLELGVAQTIAYYKEFGISQIFTHLKLPTEKKQ